jgi:hypothetical protein
LPRRLILAIALVLVAPGSAIAADRYAVARPLASLRNAPGSFAIGHVFAGAGVDVVARERGWVYVNAAGRCGWLIDRGLVPTGGPTAATCPDRASLAPELLFAPGSYQRGCGQGCVYPARIVPCADRTVYANYDGISFQDPVEREPVGRGTRGPRVPRYAGVRSGYRGFGLRYVTRDGLAAMIKDSRRRMPVWRFIRSECVERLALPVAGDRVVRLRRLYPAARRFHGTFRLDRGLRALVAGGRVTAFRVGP